MGPLLWACLGWGCCGLGVGQEEESPALLSSLGRCWWFQGLETKPGNKEGGGSRAALSLFFSLCLWRSLDAGRRSPPWEALLGAHPRDGRWGAEGHCGQWAADRCTQKWCGHRPWVFLPFHSGIRLFVPVRGEDSSCGQT